MEKDVTRNIEEQLSAFLDGELPEAELQLLVRRLEREPAYRETLARYAAIGGVMRGEPVNVEQIAGETHVLSAVAELPAAEGAEHDPGTETSSAKPARNVAFFPAAIAASLALFAVFGVFQSGVLDTSAGPEVAQVAQSEPSAPARVVADSRPRQATISSDRMMSYMVSHGEFSRAYHGPMVDSRVFVQPARYEVR